MAVWRCPIFDMQALKCSNKSMTDWAQILGMNRRNVEKDLLQIWDQSGILLVHSIYSQSYCTAKVHK